MRLNFAGTLNSSMKWLRGRYQIGAVLGAIAGPFSYYGGVQWGSVDLGWGFWPAMIVIDARLGLESQDMKIIHMAIERKKGVLILVNKWDLVEFTAKPG